MENRRKERENQSTIMKRLILRLIILICVCVILAAFAILVVAPQLNWNATAKPSKLEARIAGVILHRVIARAASSQTNPFPPSAENISAGEREFGEHCAVCHALDGSAHDPLGADFYPPISRLQHGAQDWSDAELYYIVSNGIRYTGMPGFGKHHDPDEIWKMILWIRHLPHLTDQERAELRQHATGSMEHNEHE